MDPQGGIGPLSPWLPSIRLWSQVNKLCRCTSDNICSSFTVKAMEIVSAMSMFNPSLLPTEDSLPSYGNEEICVLAEFCGKEAEVQYWGDLHSIAWDWWATCRVKIYILYMSFAIGEKSCKIWWTSVKWRWLWWNLDVHNYAVYKSNSRVENYPGSWRLS